jgi:3D (Asp-Asp-Asp) domain-containing protein
LKVSAGNLAETLGGKLAPVLGKGADALNKFLNQMADGKGAGGAFARAMGNTATAVKDAWQTAVGAVRRFRDRNRDDIDAAVHAVQDLAKAAQWWFRNVFRPAFKAAVTATGTFLSGVEENMRSTRRAVTGMVTYVRGLLRGDWVQAWRGARDLVGNILLGSDRSVEGILKHVRGPFQRAADQLGRAIVNGIIHGLSNLPARVQHQMVVGLTTALKGIPGLLQDLPQSLGKDLIKKLNPFGDGIGKAIAGGVGFMGSTGGKGSLMGADADLMPFASIAARMGLQTTSGLRPGSITASGNVSYHSSGDAIDESGPPSAMLRYFRFLRANFGSRLRELIHTPGGVGIKDGRPYRYTGQVARDHYDHVHVAFTGPFGDGPGKKRGDGLGRFTATSYGPPWGGIQGTGVTATGVNLRGAPHRYGIAVDPRVIPLGSRVKVHPNPFGYDGYFTAFDTGGAIKGHHIDFYDWRGRAAQNGWGARTVRISTGGGGGGGRHGGGGGGGGSSRPRNAYVQGMTGEGTTPNMEIGSGRVRVGGNRDVTFEGTPLSGPGQGGYEQHVADTELRQATARSGNNLAGVIKALQDELKLKVRRLKTVRKALARRLRPDTRKTLTDEATTLVGEIADLRGTLKEYRADRRGGATTVTQAEGLEAGVDPNAPGPVTPEDILGSQAARASLTPGLDDDLAVAMQQENRAWQIMQAQLADRDPRNDAEAISNYQAAAANRQSFQDTIKDNTDALKEHTDALQAVGDQQKRANDLAAQIGSSGEAQVRKLLAEIMSGQFGRGIVGRSFTPGSGAIAQY